MSEMSVFEYANVCTKAFEANLGNVGNYRRRTTFYADLSIAEYYGQSHIEDTYNRVIKEWLNNIEYITEFVLCLNYKLWEHHKKSNKELALLYDGLWRKAVSEVLEHYKDDQKSLLYYYEITD
jgi:hypothetical protein